MIGDDDNARADRTGEEVPADEGKVDYCPHSESLEEFGAKLPVRGTTVVQAAFRWQNKPEPATLSQHVRSKPDERLSELSVSDFELLSQ